MPKLYDIGKKLGVKILKQNFQLTSVDDMNLDQKIVDNKSTRFTLSCYGMRKHKTTSRSRFAVWGEQESDILSKVGIAPSSSYDFLEQNIFLYLKLENTEILLVNNMCNFKSFIQ